MIDELEILRAWSPPEDEDTAAARTRARARLDAHIAAATRSGAAPRRRTPWGFARRRRLPEGVA
ncbi:MAG TPA: hypothetical protein VNT55_12400, partial [Baekduia sp.]|nr:hypothetical protein [Baekduia sp.]